MADIFDVDNQENYDIDPSFEPSEEDYLASLKKTDQDGVYPTGVHPSIKSSHADDADDFYSMMSQQTWIPEQQKKSDWKPFDIFEEFKKTPGQVLNEVIDIIGTEPVLKAGEVLDKSGILSWGKMQEQINMDRHQLEMWGNQNKQHVEWRDADGNLVSKYTSTNPSHYNEVPVDLQHWDVVDRMGWGYHLGCATKYIWRAGKKSSSHLTIEEKEVEDLQKAIVYIQKRIDLIKGDK